MGYATSIRAVVVVALLAASACVDADLGLEPSPSPSETVAPTAPSSPSPSPPPASDPPDPGERPSAGPTSTPSPRSPSPSPSERNEPQQVWRYQVGTKGNVEADFDRFARVVETTLHDDRGWALDGGILFEQVGRGDNHEFHIWLASPREVDDAAAGCSARYSCRVGDDVYINDRRWREGTDTYDDRPLIDYQRYVVLHEVGHWLELGHEGCPGSGRPAPVMQQQSISLDGCDSRVWPLERERDEVRSKHL